MGSSPNILEVGTAVDVAPLIGGMEAAAASTQVAVGEMNVAFKELAEGAEVASGSVVSAFGAMGAVFLRCTLTPNAVIMTSSAGG